MKDLTAQLEKLLSDAEDCELIGRLATARDKREPFQKLAADLRTIACDVQALIAERKLVAANQKTETSVCQSHSRLASVECFLDWTDLLILGDCNFQF